MAMQNFVFENPTRVVFGKGQIARIGQEAARFGKRALLVYGMGSVKRSGVYDKVTSSLTEAGVAFVDFPGVRSNPVLSHVLEGIALAKTEGVEMILAVGGGSVIDTAKTIAVGVLDDGDVWDFFLYKRQIRGALPILTVVTVSASASEMNAAAVITKEEGKQKYSIRSPFIYPRVSILDPTALFTLDRSYSAYSAVDAITHMLEGYFNNAEPSSPLQDRLVEGLIKTIMEATEVILREPENYNARAEMMWAATLAFNGLTTAGLGPVQLPVHMIEHSLSALYDVPHGAGLSMLLPGWMTYVIETKKGRLARLGREVFGLRGGDEEADARGAVDAFRSWFRDVNSPSSLTEGGIPGGDLSSIASHASKLAVVWGLKDYTQEAIAEVLRLSL